MLHMQYNVYNVHKIKEKKGSERGKERLSLAQMAAFKHVYTHALHKQRKENAASEFGSVFSGIHLPQAFFLHDFQKENSKEQKKAEEKFSICIRFQVCASKKFDKI